MPHRSFFVNQTTMLIHSLDFQLRRWGLLQYESWTGNPKFPKWHQKQNFQAPVECSLGQHRHHKFVGAGQAKQLPFVQLYFSCRRAAPVYLPAHTGIMYIKSRVGFAVAQYLFLDYDYKSFYLFCWILLGLSVLCSQPQWKENHWCPHGDTSHFSHYAKVVWFPPSCWAEKSKISKDQQTREWEKGLGKVLHGRLAAVLSLQVLAEKSWISAHNI